MATILTASPALRRAAVRRSGAPKARARFAARQISASDRLAGVCAAAPPAPTIESAARRRAAHDLRGVIPAMARCSRPPIMPRSLRCRPALRHWRARAQWIAASPLGSLRLSPNRPMVRLSGCNAAEVGNAASNGGAGLGAFGGVNQLVDLVDVGDGLTGGIAVGE